MHFITKSNKVLLRVNPICDIVKWKKSNKRNKKNKRIHLTCRKKAFSPIWTAMKRSLRQDAEHRNPKVDPRWSLFSSGVCWHLPVPSAIIKKKTSVFPPLVGSLSQASFSNKVTRFHDVISTPPESAGSRRLLQYFLRWQAQLLSFQHCGVRW